jgi:ATP-binding protein involved in chromosome partitioning
MVQDIDVRDNTVFFTFVLTTPACPMKDRFIEDCTNAIQQYVDPNLKVKISWDSKVTAQRKGE